MRWRAQDAEGALLRDQLRQAAALWETRHRLPQLLWSGASLDEFRLWRKRYPGGLSAVEEAYAHAMLEHASRRARRRRIWIGAAFGALLLVLGAMTSLYSGSEEARRNGEAARLLALGRLELEGYPSAAVAYSMASLELEDDPAARRLALQALWTGPTALSVELEGNTPWDAAFSPNGQWLAAGLQDKEIWVWPSTGGPPRKLNAHSEPVHFVAFTPDSSKLVSCGRDNTLRVWAIPEGRCLRRIDLPGPGRFVIFPDGTRLHSASVAGEVVLQSWPLAGGEPATLARLPGTPSYLGLAIEPAGTKLLLGAGREVGLLDVAGAGPGRWQRIGSLDKYVHAVAFHPGGRLVASADAQGEIRLWTVPAAGDPTPAEPKRVLAGHQGSVLDIEFSPDGSILASCGTGGAIRLWEMPDAVADPIVLRAGKVRQFTSVSFHPSGHWLATGTSTDDRLLLWPLARRYARTFRGPAATTVGLAFDPRGQWIAAASMDGTVRRWPLRPDSGQQASVLFELDGDALYDLQTDGNARFLLAGSNAGPAWLIPLGGGAARALTGFGSYAGAVALSPDGRRAFAIGGQNKRRDAVLRIWETDGDGTQARTLDPDDGQYNSDIAITPDGRQLAIAGGAGLRVCDLERGSFRTLTRGPCTSVDVSRDGRFVLSDGESGLVLCALVDGTCRVLPRHAGKGQGLAVAFHPSGELVASGDGVGVIRVGSVRGEEPHLLLGNERFIPDLAFDPDGESLASTSYDGTVRLWPIPHGRPFHTLPYGELLARFRALTNLRVVRDATDPSGYGLEDAPFPGWRTVPSW